MSPPGDHHLSDALGFLVVGQNIVAARNRYRKWPADFDRTGDHLPGAVADRSPGCRIGFNQSKFN